MTEPTFRDVKGGPGRIVTPYVAPGTVVGISSNGDATYTAWIYSRSFTGSYAACTEWLRNNGEIA